MLCCSSRTAASTLSSARCNMIVKSFLASSIHQFLAKIGSDDRQSFVSFIGLDHAVHGSAKFGERFSGHERQ